jgi:predicted enzyme related to lactoylglutathione lyase
MPHPFIHVELLSTDTRQARGFYSQIFNWTFREIPREGNPYTMIDVGEGTGATS